MPVTVINSSKPTATIRGGGTVCAGSSVTLHVSLTGTAPWSLTYSDGTTNHVLDSITSSPYQLTVTADSSKTYTILNVTDANCSNSADNSSTTMDVAPIEKGIRYDPVNTFAFVPTPLKARNLGAYYTYNWNPATGLDLPTINDPVFYYDRKMEYTITMTSREGCKTTDTLLVLVQNEGQVGLKPDLFVPKAWTPNGDGSNDALFPFLIKIKQLTYFRIFNRWGQLMFETHEFGKGWDGKLNGTPQVSDVYTWTVEAVGIDGSIIKRSGNSILLR